MKKGFTLLELLIVVIIIGVLATMALPNFFRGVERARWAEAKSVLGTLRASQIRYKAQNGSYTNDINKLDVTISPSLEFTYGVSDVPARIASATRSRGEFMGQTIYIDEDGAIDWGGLPDWLK